ncbi:ATP-binding protein [Actinomadura violacea]|uniref:ATP-binding protein n=1 Tax=Actinomadura violacea TaxID=2819934 RepID=A0ABS3S3F0_9ACTN|nr:ATP-binding protein [Actinomadura violacea]MBO2463527.1 ATP-binding protein [Actinomadura violacea]
MSGTTLPGTSWSARARTCRLRDGGFPGLPLPSGDGAPAAARAAVRALLTELRMPPDAAHDAKVIVSELATNAVLHSGRARGLPPAGGLELWAHLRWRTRPEIVVTVFDPGPWPGPGVFAAPRSAPPGALGGRGLQVVDALTAAAGGRWGGHPTRSRLGARPAPGKAVFFSLPLPDGAAPGPLAGLRPAERIGALLVARGLEPVLTGGPEATELSVPDGPSCRVVTGRLTCTFPGSAPVGHPAADAVEVAEQIVRWHEEKAAAVVPAPRPGA